MCCPIISIPPQVPPKSHCSRCEYITCEKLHGYVGVDCQVSAGRPCNTCSRLADLDAEISHTRDLLVDLVSKKIALHAEINNHHDPISRDLPPEIISQVFTFYVEGISSGLKYPRSATSIYEGRWSAPLLLSSVCRAWREVALSTPELWTLINVFLEYSLDLPAYARMAEIWIARSGQLSLDVTIEFDDNIQYDLDQMRVLPLVNLIRNHFSRWRRLSLRIPMDYYQAFIGGLTGAPLLELLQLNPIMTNSDPLSIFQLPGTPRLTHLETSSTSISRVHVRFDNLTFFKGDLLSSQDIIRLLSSAKSLIRCEFSNVVGDIVLAQTEGGLVHQSLKELSIGPRGDAFGPRYDNFLQEVLTPSLEKFTFDFASSVYCALPVEHLLVFLNRSRCRLKHIALLNYNDRLYWPNEETIQLLEGLPTVESVTLSTLRGDGAEIFSDLFLQRLAQDNLIPSTDVHLDVLLPRLQVLSFSGLRSFNWGRLADTLEAAFKPENEGVSVPLSIGVDPEGVSTLTFNQSRSLHLVELDLLPHDDLFDYIDDPAALSRLRRIRDTPGITLRIQDKNTGSDLIDQSLKFISKFKQ